MPLRDTLTDTWWIYPCSVFALSLGPLVIAYGKLRDLRDDDPKHDPLERVAFAFLGNVLLDAAVLVLVAAALILAARDA